MDDKQKQPTKKQKPTVSKEAVEQQLYNKKIRTFEWAGDKLVGIVLADGTKLSAADITIQAG